MKQTHTIEKSHSKTRVRPVRLRTSGASMERRSDGSIIIRPDEPLGDYPRVLTERLTYWASVAPDRALAAKRDERGEWRYLTYGDALRKVRSLGQVFLDRGLSANRPVVILSGNDLEHLLLMLAGQHVGVPTASIAPPYSLISTDFAKLRHVMNTLTPGMVFVSHAKQYGRALQAAIDPAVEIVFAKEEISGRRATPFDDLANTAPTGAVQAAHAAIQPDDIAKFLFSSGSTGLPKAVINTHRMVCSNQQMIRQVFPFLADEPPVMVDWMPWNHTAGGNHNTGFPLYNGGTIYIDDGRPSPAGIEETVRNLREIAPTIYFNMPRGYDELLPHFRSDAVLRQNFFSRVKLLFYAGAALSQPLWDAYRELMIEARGERIMMATGLGATETSPMALQCSWDTEQSGVIGIPISGVEAKLVPVGGKLECRVKGPNVTPGYWKEPELTCRAFDEEGYYRFGDAVRFLDPEDVNKGLMFDGRLAEDFKLASATFVNVGPLRSKIIHWFAPYITDVVIAGHDRNYLAVLLVPNLERCCALVPELGAANSPVGVLQHQTVRKKIQSLLESLAAQATGNSNRVERAMLLEEPPLLDAGEITDKGSLNQRVILERRTALVEELYAPNPSARVLCVGESASKK